MSIEGINQELCSKCKICLKVCDRRYFREDSSGNIVYENNTNNCIFCGHCIAACPDDAIKRSFNWEDDVEKYTEPVVSYEKTMQLLRMNRSIRNYKQKQVPKELIKKVFDAMRYAPSAGNARLWKYKVLSNPEKIAELGDVISRTMWGYWGYKSYEQAKEYFESMGRDTIFNKAPIVIILYLEREIPNNTMYAIWGVDTGIAITYGQLAAESLGLGTCWMNVLLGAISVKKEEILEIIGIKGLVLGAMTLGYPAIKYSRPTPRAPLDVEGLE
jgi:nitroreductase/NAD-dependent dihydropyrimidine dehydrogenase PreA subunit